MRGEDEASATTAEATLAPLVEGGATFFPFELTWRRPLALSAHSVALLRVEVGGAGESGTRAYEVPVLLDVAHERTRMNPDVTRAVCEMIAGHALEAAALWEEPAAVIRRRLDDAVGFVRGRATAAGLDPARELGPTLAALALARGMVDSEEPPPPLLKACAEGIGKRYDSTIGSLMSPIHELGDVHQQDGARRTRTLLGE